MTGTYLRHKGNENTVQKESGEEDKKREWDGREERETDGRETERERREEV